MRWPVVFVLAVLAAALGAQPASADQHRRPILVPGKPVVVLSADVPRRHKFGDLIVASLELSVNPTLVDPRSVGVEVLFAPYRVMAPRTRRTERRGGRLVVRYAFPLQRLDANCLPGELDKPFELPPATVRYVPRRAEDAVTFSVEWPPLTAGSRLTRRDVEQPEFRASLPVTSESGSSLLAWALAADAVLVLAAGGALAWHLWPEAPPLAPATAARAREPTSLAAALRVAENAESVSAEERRTALEALARSLEDSGAPALAVRARRLAWSETAPTSAAMRELAAAVRREVPEAA